MITTTSWLDGLSEPNPNNVPHQAPATNPASVPAIAKQSELIQPMAALQQRPNPWQRFGTAFTPTDDAGEAFIRSGLNWTVEKVGLRTQDLAPVPGRFAIRRSDSSEVLGIVGQDFVPLQNADAFAFFRDLAQEGRITFETAGSFDHGAIVWVQARLPDLQIRLGEDISEAMLFISNGHVGNKPLTIAPTTFRIICRNSLRMAEAQGAQERRRRPGLEVGWTVRHTRGMTDALADIREAYASTRRNHTVTVQAYEHLAGKQMTTRLKNAFFDRVFTAAAGPDESERAATIAKHRRERLEAILASPTSQVKGTKDTAFSLLQSAIEFIDHDRTTRAADGEDPAASRLLSSTFGSGAGLKAKAWSAMLDLVHA